MTDARTASAITHLICCDWGTSRLRLRLLSRATGEVVAERASEQGVQPTYRHWKAKGGDRSAFFLDVLATQARPLVERAGVSPGNVAVVASGMASSSLGLRELPYGELPLDLAAPALPAFTTTCRIADRDVSLLLVSGVASTSDVMRGEEVELAGLHAAGALPSDTVVILPGTHSKHAHIQNGRLQRFQTYMTGELLDVLVHHSVLSNAVSRTNNTAGYAGDFEAGVEAGAGGRLARGLFEARAATLLGRRTPEQSYWYLSGLLIGAELGDLERLEPPDVTLAATGVQEELYPIALRTLSLPARARILAPDQVSGAAVRGQHSIWEHAVSQGLLAL